jgi:hypothetical protein
MSGSKYAGKKSIPANTPATQSHAATVVFRATALGCGREEKTVAVATESKIAESIEGSQSMMNRRLELFIES